MLIDSSRYYNNIQWVAATMPRPKRRPKPPSTLRVALDSPNHPRRKTRAAAVAVVVEEAEEDQKDVVVARMGEVAVMVEEEEAVAEVVEVPPRQLLPWCAKSPSACKTQVPRRKQEG
jgi:hypothetical protein